jgi:hypothetical protein
MNNQSQSLKGDGFKVLVQERIKNFWGYGSLESPTWFVGMEEGFESSTDPTELITRFKATHGHTTVDMRNGMEEVADHIRWFQPGAPIQPTWKYPIALYLYLKNTAVPTKEDIRDYQAIKLGDTLLHETAAIELMPLPSNRVSKATWMYGDVNLPHLQTRDAYLEAYKPAQVQKLKQMIAENHPKLIIFYSLTYLPEWIEIIGLTPREMTKGMYFAYHGDTAYCVIPQSASFGMSYKRVYEFADTLDHTAVTIL